MHLHEWATITQTKEEEKQQACLYVPLRSNVAQMKGRNLALLATQISIFFLLRRKHCCAHYVCLHFRLWHLLQPPVIETNESDTPCQFLCSAHTEYKVMFLVGILISWTKKVQGTHLIMSLVRFTINSHVHTGNEEMLVNRCIQTRSNSCAIFPWFSRHQSSQTKNSSEFYFSLYLTIL